MTLAAKDPGKVGEIAALVGYDVFLDVSKGGTPKDSIDFLLYKIIVFCGTFGWVGGTEMVTLRICQNSSPDSSMNQSLSRTLNNRLNGCLVKQLFFIQTFGIIQLKQPLKMGVKSTRYFSTVKIKSDATPSKLYEFRHVHPFTFPFFSSRSSI